MSKGQGRVARASYEGGREEGREGGREGGPSPMSESPLGGQGREAASQWDNEGT